MSTVAAYKICTEESVSKLEKSVNDSIQQGFQPIGKLVVERTISGVGKLAEPRFFHICIIPF